MTHLHLPSIPLTTNEWEEWGNPNEDKYFDYMLSYSPYDNVREQVRLAVTLGVLLCCVLDPNTHPSSHDIRLFSFFEVHAHAHKHKLRFI